MDDALRIRVTLPRIEDPRELDDPQLRDIGIAAAWLAKVREAIDDLAHIVGTLDLPVEELVSVSDQYALPWEADSLAVAHHLICVSHHEGTQGLEALMASWLGASPDHWPMLCLLLFDPWHEIPGHWHEDTPDWIRTLDPVVTRARANNGPFGRNNDMLG